MELNATNSLRQIYNTVMALPSLVPTDEVSQTFGSLLKVILQSDQDGLDKSNLTEQEILQLRYRFGQSVYELEKYWAHKILDSHNHQLTLEQYPQWDNYLKVMQREWKAIQLYASDSIRSKTLLIGGGPIPLTAIILAQKYGVSSVVLDSDAEAIDLAKKIIIALGLQGQITLVHSSGENFNAYHEYSLILVAGLAGIDSKDKQCIFDAIRSQAAPNTFILTRSSYGARKLLYLSLPPSIQQQFETVTEIHPDDDMMNSIVLLKTAGRQHE